MGVETVAEALEREHKEIDESIEAYTAALAAGDEPDPEPLVRAVAALRRHIFLEEEFLFPPMREANLAMPVFVMVREHGQMWKVMDALDAALTGGEAGPTTVADLLRELTEGLQAHNPKEEQILYPQAGQILNQAATAELQDLIKSGETPKGWVCEALQQ